APAGAHGLEEGAHLRSVSLVAPLPALHGGPLPSAMKGRGVEVVDHDREAGTMDLDPLLRERGVAAGEIVDPRGRAVCEGDLDVEALVAVLPRGAQRPRVDRHGKRAREKAGVVDEVAGLADKTSPA